MIRTRTTRLLLATTALAALAFAGTASAQAPKPAASRPATPAAPAAPAQAPIPSTPQQTSATYGDWTLRCTQIDANRACEIVQTLQQNDRPIAQIAIGKPLQSQKMQLVVMVPTNVTLHPEATVTPGSEGDAPPLASLTWRRCLPTGCMADAALDPAMLAKLRGWTEAGRIGFADGNGQPAKLPMSPRGLPQAMDALAKETGPS